jgi:hypothetical protein
MTLRFSDGMSFDTEGELHVEFRHDGLYVIGRDMVIPVKDKEEAQEIIESIKGEQNGG